MGIPSTLSRVPAATPYVQYIATPGQTVFPYTFPITQDQDLVVVVNGVTQSTDVGYTVSDQGNPLGGFVTFLAARSGGDVVTVYRDIVIERLTQISQNSGYSSVTFNAEFNNIYLILQQLSEKLAYTLQIPYSNNPAPVTTLQPGTYANAYLGFDANGNPEAVALTSAGPITFQILAPILGLVATEAEIDKGVTASITDFTKDPGDLRRYGGLLSSLDNSAALAAAVAQCTSTAADSAHVFVPPGNWAFASAAAAVCALPSGVAIRGAGREVTVLTVTGSANTTGFFVGTDIADFTLSDLTLVGNSVASGFTDGGAVFMRGTAAATGLLGNYQIDRCRFTNFKATYWVTQYGFSAGAQTYGFRGFFVRDCDFVSLPGNAQSTSIAVPAYCIMAVGNTGDATSQNIEVKGCTADCTYIKGFFLDFGGNAHVNVHDNVVVNAGADSFFADDSGCYAFASYSTGYHVITNISNAASAVVSSAGHAFVNGDTVTISQVYGASYASGNPDSLMRAVNDQSFVISGVVAGVSYVIPVNTAALAVYSAGGVGQALSWCTQVRYHHNTIDGVRDCGFYFASCQHVEATDNEISGQTCNIETTLLKGAIVAAGCRDAYIANNKIVNCQQGIHAEPLIHIGDVTISGNKIQDCPTGCEHILVQGCYPNSVSGSVSNSAHITDNQVISRVVTDVTHSAIRINVSNIYGLRRLKISGNTLDVIGHAINIQINGTGNATIYDVDISGNKIVANGGIAVQLQGAQPYYTLMANHFVGGIYFVDTDHLSASGCRTAVVGNTFEGGTFTSGSWVRCGAPAAGSVFRGNVFQNVLPANMISSADAVNLGVDLPNWVGKQGHIVETPLAVEAGAGGSKYINTGYWYDATAVAWLPMRTLTGN